MSFGKSGLVDQLAISGWRPEYARPLMKGNYIDQMFGMRGLLESQMPGYVFRSGQYRMAQEVDAIFLNGGTLLAEGPTGTGKSFAYLIPMMNYASSTGKRGLVVTANIALQEQLLKKDLPRVSQLYGGRPSFVSYKGKNNYLCIYRLGKTLDEMKEDAERARKGKRPKYNLSQAELQQQNQLIEWSKRTKTGDKSELHFTPLPKVWSRFSSDFRTCTGCGSKDCYAMKSRAPMHAADVIVTNYYVLFTHLSKTPFLPQYDYLVLDEAHKIVDIARQFYGEELSQWAIRRVITDVIDFPEAKNLLDVTKTYFEGLENYRKSEEYKGHVPRILREIPHKPLRDALLGMKKPFDEEIALYEANAKTAKTEEAEQQAKARAKDLAKTYVRCQELAEALDDFGELRRYGSHVYFLEEQVRGNLPKLCVQPIDVSPLLREQIFDKTKTIVTSATLRASTLGNNEGMTFRYISGELGAQKARQFVAESPFDWQRQAYIVTECEMPYPTGKTREDFTESVNQKLVRIIELAKGRTLALFTSHKAMKSAYEYVSRHVNQYTLLVQGQKPRIKLLREFSEDTHSCLFGTDSFWAGVDVPGPALSCVVMDKLPFKRPDDPIISYYSLHYPKDWFRALMLPAATIQFRQGFGRLIRTINDVGVVVILDPRVSTKNYGSCFLKSLPDLHAADSIEKIPAIL
jgi:ATP-dependent DNA helicase DinG